MARIFTALLLPPEVEAHLNEHIDGTRIAHPFMRWVKPARWHVTLEFLGECGPREVDRQMQRWMRRARRSAPMQLRISGAGTFPQPWMARVLWVGLTGDVEVWRKLAAFDQQPHITVARTRERRDLTSLANELSSYSGPVWKAEHVALVESYLRGADDRGPRYQPLEYFPLGGVFPSALG